MTENGQRVLETTFFSATTMRVQETLMSKRNVMRTAKQDFIGRETGRSEQKCHTNTPALQAFSHHGREKRIETTGKVR
jgi:hypothetical protein